MGAVETRSLEYHWGTTALVFDILSFKLFDQRGDFIVLHLNDILFIALFFALFLKVFLIFESSGFLSAFGFLYSLHLQTAY